jgi:predicted metal-dependent phosphoesterase TrpH
MCGHTPEQLISRAAEFGYEVLALTCHNKDIWTERLADYARSQGIVLIPGMEVAVERTRHTLVYNFHTGRKNLNTFDKIRNRSGQDTLVIAPHAFFPGFTCLHGLLEKNLDVFDAIEYSGFQIQGFDYNRRSVDFSQKTGKPLVGFGDIHYLWQLDRTYTWIYAEPDLLSVISAIKQGFVRIQTSPLSWPEAFGWWSTAFWRFFFPVNTKPSGKRILGNLFPARD